RQDLARGDAPGDDRHARGRARLPRADGRADRGQARGRHPHVEGRHQVPRRGQRDRGRRLARPRLVPVRGVVAAQRRAHAAQQARHRHLLGPRLRDRRLSGTKDTMTTTASTAGSPFEYAPAPESRAVVDIASSYGLFVDGEFTPASDSGSFKTVNPATEEVLAEVAEATEEDVDRAVRAARRAQEKVWGPMPGRERDKYLFRIARLLAERSREFAVLETLDNGKPIRESRDVDVPTAAAHFFYYAGWADKLEHAGYGPD